MALPFKSGVTLASIFGFHIHKIGVTIAPHVIDLKIRMLTSLKLGCVFKYRCVSLEVSLFLNSVEHNGVSYTFGV